jgi:hypothetical protein
MAMRSVAARGTRPAVTNLLEIIDGLPETVLVGMLRGAAL